MSFSQWTWEQFSFPATARMLEVGCGSGALWLANRERMLPGWQVMLTDLSPGMIADVARTVHPRSPTIACLVADVQDLPFDDASFDAVLAMHML